jgi:APA family basic amino acid/polyamine antiporter
MDSPVMEYSDIKRRIGLFTATAIVVANMIGTGIFTTSGIIAGQLPGPGWVLFCWIFGGVIALAGALCYAELATRMPREGGEYVYLRELYHPVLGFLTGWTSFFVGFSAPIAGSALAFVAYFSAGFARFLPDVDPAQAVLIEKAVAVAIIAAFTLLHYLGVRTGARVQNVLTVVKVIILAGLTSAGMILGGGSWENLSARVAAPSGGLAFGTAMMLVMFAYSGWNASAYIAGELKDPRRTLPRSLVSGTLIVIVLYVAVNLFIFRAVRFDELRGIIPVVEAAAVAAFGQWMGTVLSVMIGIALLSSLSAFLMIGPRVYFAMARDRLFFPFASRVDPRSGVPGRSILIQGGLAVIMVAIGSFEQLLVYIGFSLGIFPWLAVLGVFIARRRKVGEAGAVKVWGFPVVPIFFLASSLVLMIVAYINRPVESTAAIVTVAAGVPCYYLWIRGVGKRRGGRP